MALTPKDIQKNRLALAPFDKKRIEQLHEIEREAFARFSGQFDELEAAFGLLHLGDHLGWKPLVLIHNKRTIKKYEEILDINIREFFPPEGPSEARSQGYAVAKKIGNFWKAVSGEIKDDELKAQRRELAQGFSIPLTRVIPYPYSQGYGFTLNRFHRNFTRTLPVSGWPHGLPRQRQPYGQTRPEL